MWTWSYPYPGRSTRYHALLIKKWFIHLVLPASNEFWGTHSEDCYVSTARIHMVYLKRLGQACSLACWGDWTICDTEVLSTIPVFLRTPWTRGSTTKSGQYNLGPEMSVAVGSRNQIPRERVDLHSKTDLVSLRRGPVPCGWWSCWWGWTCPHLISLSQLFQAWLLWAMRRPPDCSWCILKIWFCSKAKDLGQRQSKLPESLQWLASTLHCMLSMKQDYRQQLAFPCCISPHYTTAMRKKFRLHTDFQRTWMVFHLTSAQHLLDEM